MSQEIIKPSLKCTFLNMANDMTPRLSPQKDHYVRA